jgi:hypothetical protein
MIPRSPFPGRGRRASLGQRRRLGPVRVLPGRHGRLGDRVDGLAALDPAGAHLELGHLGDRVEGVDGEHVGGHRPGPVVGHEHRVGPDRLGDQGRVGNGAAAGLHPHRVAVGETERGVDLDPRPRGLLDQAGQPAGLVAGQEVGHRPPGGQPQRVRLVERLGRGPPLDRDEAGLAVGVVEAAAWSRLVDDVRTQGAVHRPITNPDSRSRIADRGRGGPGNPGDREHLRVVPVVDAPASAPCGRQAQLPSEGPSQAVARRGRAQRRCPRTPPSSQFG